MNNKSLKKARPTFFSAPVLFRSSLVSGVLLLGACTTNSGSLSNFGFNKSNWFNQPTETVNGSVTLPGDPNVLGNGNDTALIIQNAIELARQKRFKEARHILAEVRDLQNPQDDGYRAITCAIALLALRSGNIKIFKRAARQLDASLGKPLNVAPSYVEVVSLYRVLTDQSLPVNAPEGIKRLKDEQFPVEKAQLVIEEAQI